GLVAEEQHRDLSTEAAEVANWNTFFKRLKENPPGANITELKGLWGKAEAGATACAKVIVENAESAPFKSDFERRLTDAFWAIGDVYRGNLRDRPDVPYIPQVVPAFAALVGAGTLGVISGSYGSAFASY